MRDLVQYIFSLVLAAGATLVLAAVVVFVGGFVFAITEGIWHRIVSRS